MNGLMSDQELYGLKLIKIPVSKYSNLLEETPDMSADAAASKSDYNTSQPLIDITSSSNLDQQLSTNHYKVSHKLLL